MGSRAPELAPPASQNQAPQQHILDLGYDRQQGLLPRGAQDEVRRCGLTEIKAANGPLQLAQPRFLGPMEQAGKARTELRAHAILSWLSEKNLLLVLSSLPRLMIYHCKMIGMGYILRCVISSNNETGDSVKLS